MRATFVVGATLLGVFVLYEVIRELPIALAAIAALPSTGSEYAFWNILAFGLRQFIGLVLCVFLVLRAGWIADRLKLRDEPAGEASRCPEMYLRMGIVLVGLYVALSMVPLLGKLLLEAYAYRAEQMRLHFQLGRAVEPILGIALAGVCLLRCDLVIRILRKHGDQKLFPEEADGAES
ncbi:MAG: hypothetical protein V2A58_10300 [Planctomycetota bacterium]